MNDVFIKIKGTTRYVQRFDRTHSIIDLCSHERAKRFTVDDAISFLDRYANSGFGLDRAMCVIVDSETGDPIEDSSPVTDDEIMKVMETYGGSFVKALARAWRVGDRINKGLIKATWPVYWEEYAEMAIAERNRTT